MTQLPTISILVATWNCAEQLQQFLASLESQTWRPWECLILDNSSTDSTAELVADTQRRILGGSHSLRWSSQPDMGIYDAWNRGLKLARGRYVCFVGSDDVFLDPTSLGRIAALTMTDVDLITARNEYYAPDGRFLRHWGSNWQWKRMRQSMNIAHPGMLIKRDLFDVAGEFDTSFRICGDYEWFLRLPPGLRTIHSSDSVLKVVQGGVSHTRIRQVYKETFRAQCSHVSITASAACWAFNWAKYCRRRLIGLA